MFPLERNEMKISKPNSRQEGSRVTRTRFSESKGHSWCGKLWVWNSIIIGDWMLKLLRLDLPRVTL